MTGPVVVGLDLSLTSTGLAVVADGEVVDVSRVRSTGRKGATVEQTAHRIGDLAAEVVAEALVSHLDGAPHAPDLVVIEAPSFGSANGAAHERGGLWWMVASRLHRMGARLGTVAPTTRAKYATGSGRAEKWAVYDAVCQLYPWPALDGLRAMGWRQGNDMADAVVLAAMGSRWLGYPIEVLPEAQAACVDKGSWPTWGEAA